jgi:hypothetical protein
MLPESIAGLRAGTPPTLVLDRLPSGEFAWLRPELDTAIRDADRVHQDLTRFLRWPEPRPEDRGYAITQAGRDYLARQRAMQALFGPWPLLSEVRP